MVKCGLDPGSAVIDALLCTPFGARFVGRKGRIRYGPTGSAR